MNLNTKPCRLCGRPIEFKDTKNGKKAPHDPNGEVHFATCPVYNSEAYKAKQREATKKSYDKAEDIGACKKCGEVAQKVFWVKVQDGERIKATCSAGHFICWVPVTEQNRKLINAVEVQGPEDLQGSFFSDPPPDQNHASSNESEKDPDPDPRDYIGSRGENLEHFYLFSYRWFSHGS